MGPNPFNESFTLYVVNPIEEVRVEMYNDIGQLIFQEVRYLMRLESSIQRRIRTFYWNVYCKVYVGNESQQLRLLKTNCTSTIKQVLSSFNLLSSIFIMSFETAGQPHPSGVPFGKQDYLESFPRMKNNVTFISIYC